MICQITQMILFQMRNSRSSRPKVFCKKGVLRNFTKFTGKHLCQSLFFNNVAGLRPATLLKKGLWRRCFPVNFVKFLRTPFFTEHLWWLLLEFPTQWFLITPGVSKIKGGIYLVENYLGIYNRSLSLVGRLLGTLSAINKWNLKVNFSRSKKL